MTSTRQLPDQTNLMEELAQRCERASGPDRELDGKIASATGWECDGKTFSCIAWRAPDETIFHRSSATWPPEFTASLDAAVTLVPSDKYWHVGHGRTRDDEPLGGASIIAPGSLDTIAEAEATTAALALCAASLRARKGLE